MNFRDDILESVSLLPPDDPERLKLEAALPQAPPELRRRYAQLLAEAQGLTELVVGNTPGAPADPHADPHPLALPESLLGRLRQIPTRTPARHPHFLTPFRAVAAAALLLLMLAPAAAWFLPPALLHHRLLMLPKDVVAEGNPQVQVSSAAPDALIKLFATSDLSFLPDFPAAKTGASVLGGGLTSLAGKPAAYVVYACKDKRLTLFEVARADFPLPSEGSYPLISTLQGDRSVRFWSRSAGDTTLFLAVSQCGEDNGLDDFVALPAAATQP
ncbi:MAG TPA: hypothetical protein VH253_18505 [Phycisphaerae bacterium]|nr:hypothetical protein [Phycisphaerae bacterium]